MDENRNILGLQESMYMSDFKGIYVPPVPLIQKIFDRVKKETKDSAVKAAPVPREYWMGSSMIKIRLCDMPKFNQFQHEPKEIVKTPPVLNFECSTKGTADFLEKHKEIIRTRPKCPAAPCEPFLDDINDPEGRERFVNYTYTVDKIPEAKPKNVELYGEPVEAPDTKFSTEKFTSVQRPYPAIKPNLKRFLRQHERIQERNYDYFGTNFISKGLRKEKVQAKSWGDDILQVHDHDLTTLKYRNYKLGYTGHITDKTLDLKSKRKMTVDPMLSFAKAIESRYDKHDCRTSPELQDPIKKMDPKERRTEMGVIHLPVDSYYHPCLTNKPYRMRGDCLAEYEEKN